MAKPKDDRPTEYTAEIGAEVADRHADGASITQIAQDETMPTRKTILLWIGEIQEFAVMMNQARDAYVDAIAEECLQIADDETVEMTTTIDGNGRRWEHADKNAVKNRQLKISTRMKLLEKWAPHRYGNKKAVELSGPGGGPIQSQQAHLVAVTQAGQSMSDNELVRRISFGLDRVKRHAALPGHAMKLPALEVGKG